MDPGRAGVDARGTRGRPAAHRSDRAVAPEPHVGGDGAGLGIRHRVQSVGAGRYRATAHGEEPRDQRDRVGCPGADQAGGHERAVSRVLLDGVFASPRAPARGDAVVRAGRARDGRVRRPRVPGHAHQPAESLDLLRQGRRVRLPARVQGALHGGRRAPLLGHRRRHAVQRAPLSMEVSRRDLLRLVVLAGGAGLSPRALAEAADAPARLLGFPALGNVTLLHMTDPHATLLPVFYREPDTLLGVGSERGRTPYVTGQAALRAWHLTPGSVEAYACASVDFVPLAARYGRLGGYAHLATLVARIRAERPGRTLLLDGGDTLQGSATALWSRGEDMVRAMNLLGVEVFTPHWEFTYGLDRVRELFGDRERRGLFTGDFVAHNVRETDLGEPVFHPYTRREGGGVRVGVIGQAFPYTPVAHPRRFVSDLTFGIREEQVQALVTELRDQRHAEVVVLLSHNGVGVDLKLASRVRGLDIILGGHTHDPLAEPTMVGKTLVVNSGSHGKFLSRLDLDVRGGRVAGHRYRLLPVLSQALDEDPAMAALIREVRAPHEAGLGEVLAVSESLLYRRGNFNGPFDEVILDALLARAHAQVAFSPGFRC